MIFKVFKQLAAGSLLASAMVVGSQAQAADWSSTNVQLLYGQNYEVGQSEETVLTLEHADGWKYGDNYFFVDVIEPFNNDTAFYGELSPRISPAAIFGFKPFAFGPVKDVMIAGTLEMGGGGPGTDNGVHSYLLGIGLPLDIPGFAFADVNIYARKSHRDFVSAIPGGEQSSMGGQVTIDWLYPFGILGTKWTFGGYLDYSFAENSGTVPIKNHIVSSPQLLLDVGDLIGMAPGQLKAGIEYDYWMNKYGIDGIDENNVNAMIEWVF